MSARTNYSSGAIWEDRVGYCRAVKVGQQIEVSGTVAANERGEALFPGDAYGQTKYILEKIARVLSEAGASMSDVVRTRMFVTDISRFDEYGKAHGEYFAAIKPATSMLEVKGLVGEGFLIEIEATAIIGSRQ